MYRQEKETRINKVNQSNKEIQRNTVYHEERVNRSSPVKKEVLIDLFFYTYLSSFSNFINIRVVS